eukprot:2370092-Alexandrium_andersonii.AAC.1
MLGAHGDEAQQRPTSSGRDRIAARRRAGATVLGAPYCWCPGHPIRTARGFYCIAVRPRAGRH